MKSFLLHHFQPLQIAVGFSDVGRYIHVHWLCCRLINHCSFWVSLFDPLAKRCHRGKHFVFDLWRHEGFIAHHLASRDPFAAELFPVIRSLA